MLSTWAQKKLGSCRQSLKTLRSCSYCSSCPMEKSHRLVFPGFLCFPLVSLPLELILLDLELKTCQSSTLLRRILWRAANLAVNKPFIASAGPYRTWPFLKLGPASRCKCQDSIGCDRTLESWWFMVNVRGNSPKIAQHFRLGNCDELWIFMNIYESW